MTTVITIIWDQDLVEHELETSDPAEALARVDVLDGSDRTLVTVFREAAHMAIGGSAESGLVVYATFDGAAFHQLVCGKPTGASDELEAMVMAGGQVGAYPDRQVVDAAAAKSALQVFIDKGELDRQQLWEVS